MHIDRYCLRIPHRYRRAERTAFVERRLQSRFNIRRNPFHIRRRHKQVYVAHLRAGLYSHVGNPGEIARKIAVKRRIHTV